MSMRTAVLGGILIGSSVGGVIPVLWGDSLVSYGAILWSGIGGVAGAFLGIMIGRWAQGG
jgi:hypothetical protein